MCSKGRSEHLCSSLVVSNLIRRNYRNCFSEQVWGVLFICLRKWPFLGSFPGRPWWQYLGFPVVAKWGWDSPGMGADLLVNYVDLLVDPVVGRLARWGPIIGILNTMLWGKFWRGWACMAGASDGTSGRPRGHSPRHQPDRGFLTPAPLNFIQSMECKAVGLDGWYWGWIWYDDLWWCLVCNGRVMMRFCRGIDYVELFKRAGNEAGDAQDEGAFLLFLSFQKLR